MCELVNSSTLSQVCINWYLWLQTSFLFFSFLFFSFLFYLFFSFFWKIERERECRREGQRVRERENLKPQRGARSHDTGIMHDLSQNRVRCSTDWATQATLQTVLFFFFFSLGIYYPKCYSNVNSKYNFCSCVSVIFSSMKCLVS